MNDDYVPDEVRQELNQLPQRQQIENWLRLQHEYITGARSVLRELQLLMRESLHVNKTKQRKAIQEVHDIITVSYPDFDEVLPVTEDDIQALIDENIERGLIEDTGDGKYALTLMGRVHVEDQMKTDPETRDFMRKLDKAYDID